MALPGVTQSILDTASGALALGSDLHVKVGISSSGDQETFAIYTDPDELADDFGVGPLVEAAAYHIQNTGLPVAVIRIADDNVTDGSLGTITQSGSGPLITDGDGDTADASTPNDAYELIVKITLAGAVGTSAFAYSLDNGVTYSASQVTAASVTLTDTGINLLFPAGTYVVDETYSATCTAPSASAQGIADAIDVALNASSPFRMVHAIGYPAANSAVATLAASVQTVMAGAATNDFVYTYAMIEAADEVDATVASALSAVATNRVGVTAGFCDVISPISQRTYKRPAAWPVVAEIMRRGLSQDPGYFDPFGPISGVTGVDRDEFKTQLLDAARINTLRTYKGRQGFYVTRGRLMATSGSDFESICNRQVMDAACAVAYDALLKYTNKDLQVDATTGLLVEAEAQAIEAFVNGKLSAAITASGYASEVQFLVSRTQDVLTTSTLKTKTRILPKAYTRFIENELSFRNPALEAAAA